MSEPNDAPATTRRVVVAEDESLIRLDIVEMLRDNGFDVVGEAGDGEKAVELATELRPDLVIMDVKMPKLDGISAAEQLSKNHVAPVVLLTAFSQKELVERASEAGAMPIDGKVTSGFGATRVPEKSSRVSRGVNAKPPFTSRAVIVASCKGVARTKP